MAQSMLRDPAYVKGFRDAIHEWRHWQEFSQGEKECDWHGGQYQCGWGAGAPWCDSTTAPPYCKILKAYVRRHAAEKQAERDKLVENPRLTRQPLTATFPE